MVRVWHSGAGEKAGEFAVDVVVVRDENQCRERLVSFEETLA